MSYQKLLQQMIGVTLVILLVVGCGTPAAPPVSEAPTATSTPVPPTAMPVPTTGTIEGVLVQTDTQRTLANRRVRLHQATLDAEAGKVVIPELGTVNEKPVSETVTDEMGRFVFREIQTDSYVLTAETVRPMGVFDALVSKDGKVIANVLMRVDSIDVKGQ